MVRRYIRVTDGNTKLDGSPSRGRPVGVVVAERNEEQNGVFIGFSLCSKNDDYNPQRGNQIAEGRLNSHNYFISDNADNSMDIINDRFGLNNAFEDLEYYLDWAVYETRRRTQTPE